MSTNATQSGATPNGHPSGSAANGTSDDELQIEHQLKQLKLLHIKCRGLRSTIPRMLEAVAAKETPEELTAGFSKSVATASSEIKEFGALYSSPESQKALSEAARRREADPAGIKPWRAKDEPDWLRLDGQ